MPRHAETFRAWANFALGQNDSKNALIRAKKAAEFAPQEAQNHYVVGQCLLREGQDKEAREAFERAATLAPLNPLPARELQLLYKRLGDGAQETRWQAAYKDREAYQSERRRVETQLKVTPQDSNLRRQLAALVARTGDVEATVQEWGRALRQRPDQPSVLVQAARSLVTGGFPKTAIPLVRQVIQSAPGQVLAYETLGDAYLALDWIHEAAVAYQSASNGAPRQQTVYKKRIEEAVARRQKNPSEAWKHYVAAQYASTPEAMKQSLQKALAANPEHVESLRVLIETLYRQGKPTEALPYVNRLLVLLPEDSQANLYGAFILLQEPRTDEKRTLTYTLLSRAEASGGQTPLLLYGLGWFALQEKKYTEAVDYLKKSARLDPTSRAVLAKLVTAAQQAGDTTTATDAQKHLELLTKENKQ
jgi:tetratricopeptide (TPR) repeat protein